MSADAASGQPWSWAIVSRSASFPAPSVRDGLPLEHEAPVGRGVHRLDLASKLRERLASDGSQHVRLAQLAPRAVAEERPLDDLPVGDEAIEDRLHDADRDPEPSAKRARGEGPVRARPAKDEIPQASFAGSRKASGVPAGTATPSASL